MATAPLPDISVFPDGFALKNDLVKALIIDSDGTWKFIQGGNRPATGVVALQWNADGTFTFGAGTGIKLISPNGTPFLLSVDNNGALLTQVTT